VHNILQSLGLYQSCFCGLSNSTRKKGGCSANDLDASELLAMRLQVGRSSGLPANALTGPDVDTALTDTAVSRPAVKQQIHSRTKVGRRRVVARFDVRPQRPRQQPVSRSWQDTACNSCPPSVCPHQLEHVVSAGSDITDVKDMRTLLGDGD